MAATRQATGDVIGPYRLEDFLGGGAFGSVWRAEDSRNGQQVALKLLGAIDSVEARGEIELLAATASSTSEHVVRVLGGDVEPVPYIVMEYVDGSDLAESLTERGRLPVEEVIQVGTALADAFVALERVGIIHRDVKPGNVLLDKHGSIKLADFGIAKIAGFATVTSTRQAPMTMAYAAPEVWDGHATKQSDFYALGCVLFQCLVGSPPFEGGVGELYKAHAERLPNLGALPTNTPPSLRDVITKCLAKQPDDRPTNAVELLAALRRAAVEAEDVANAVVTSAEPRKFGPWLRRERDASRPWAWVCAHESTDEQAIVEVHGFESADGGEVLDRAYEANAALVPFGAERILGRNRLLLRPGEAWLTEPPGEFLFWVARERIEAAETLQFSQEKLAAAAAQLAGMKEAASTAGLPLELSERTLLATEDGVRVLRPGLPVVQPQENDAAALAALAAFADQDSASSLVAAGSLTAAALALAAVELGVANAAENGLATSLEHDSDSVIVNLPLATTNGGVATAAATTEAVAAPVLAPEAAQPPPPKRRFAIVPVVAVGAAGIAGVIALFAMLAGGGGDPPPPPATPTVPAAVFEILSVDCAPTTIKLGESVKCEASLGGVPDGAAAKLSWAAEGGEPAIGEDGAFATAFASTGARKRVILTACLGTDKCLEKSAFVSVNDPSIPPPETAFTCAPNPVKKGEALTCSSLAVDEGLTFDWDAPGGSLATGTEREFKTSFGDSQSHEVTLTICKVVGELQACGTAKQSILVASDATPVPPPPATGGTVNNNTPSSNNNNPPTPPPVTQPTIGSVICTPTAPKLDETVYCDATVSGPETTRTWNASGGSPASGSSSSFSTKYTSAGPKSILLRVCNGGNCDAGSASVAVSDSPPPVVNLDCRPARLYVGDPVTCYTSIASGKVTSYAWNAPTASPSTGTSDSLVLSYNSYGSRTIAVVACDGANCATVSATVQVDPPWQPPSNATVGPAPTNPPVLPTPTPTPPFTATPVPNATNTPTPTITPTPIPGATNTPTHTPTQTPTSTPTQTPTPTPIPQCAGTPGIPLVMGPITFPASVTPAAPQLPTFTFYAEIKPLLVGNGMKIFTRKGADASSSTSTIMDMWAYTPDGNLQAGLNRGGSGLANALHVVYADGQWHSVMLTFDGFALKIFTDGVLRGSSTWDPLNPGGMEPFIYVGRSITGGESFQGEMRCIYYGP